MSTCAPGKYYDVIVEECRPCDLVCGPQYQGPDSPDCKSLCPGYGSSTSVVPTTTTTVPESDNQLFLIIFTSVSVSLAVVLLVGVFLWCILKKKCFFKVKSYCDKIHQEESHDNLVPSQETGPIEESTSGRQAKSVLEIGVSQKLVQMKPDQSMSV